MAGKRRRFSAQFKAKVDLAPWNESMSNVSEFGMDAFRKGQGSWPRNGTAPSRSSQN